jgi:hypothetical protein
VEQSKYQEHEMPNGTYIVEKRMGHWMAWPPNDDQAFIVDYSYDMVMLYLRAHSKASIENEE